MQGIELSINLRHDRRSATISRVWYDRASVRPGETVTVTVALKPFRGPEVLEQLKFTVPPGTPPGPVTLVVGDAASIEQRGGGRDSEFQPTAESRSSDSVVEQSPPQ